MEHHLLLEVGCNHLLLEEVEHHLLLVADIREHMGCLRNLPDLVLDHRQVEHHLLLEVGCNHLLLEEALVPLDRRFEDIQEHMGCLHNLDLVLSHLVVEVVEH